MINLYASPTVTVQTILERLEYIQAHPEDAPVLVDDLTDDVRAWLSMCDGDPTLIDLESWSWELTEDGKHMAALPDLLDQPAVDQSDPADLAESDIVRVRTHMSEGKPTASRDICEDVVARAEAAEERADAAEWAVGELRDALTDLLDSNFCTWTDTRDDCERCGCGALLYPGPARHSAGCPVQQAEDALSDTADQVKWTAKLARYEALVKAARAFMNDADEFNDGEFWMVNIAADIGGPEHLYEMREALAALEGESNE